MDVFFRAARRVLALFDAIRDKRASRAAVPIPVTRGLRCGTSNTSRWDRRRPGYFTSAKFRA